MFEKYLKRTNVAKFKATTAALLATCLFTLFACSSDEGGDNPPNPPPTTQTCSGREYNADEFRCESGELIGSCRGMDYYIDYQDCNGGVIEDKNTTPSSSSVEPTTSSSSSLSPQISSSSGNPRCGNVEYNSSTQFCSGTTVYSKCGGNEWNPVTQICYSNNAYRIVTIGTQTWMAENLNYNATDSKCYDNNTTNCDKYGRLYDWATAMKLDPLCNVTTAGITPNHFCRVSAKHQGICPEDWHIPSEAEWNTLIARVSDLGTNSGLNMSHYLKAESGWSGSGGNGNGGDSYNFTALPGGSYSADGNFYNSGINSGTVGYWWSTSESGATGAYCREMKYNDDNMDWISYNKNNFFSVRCVKD